MPFSAGQTYLFPLNDDTLRAHLWIIATEPNEEGQFATACFTSLKGTKDQTVILQKREHKFIKWDTCVLYAAGEISSIEKLQAYLDCGKAKMYQDVPPDILRLTSAVT